MNKLQRFLEERTRPTPAPITVHELAVKLKVHPSLVTMWRSGLRRPGKSKLKALAALTGIKVEDLL
jgi:transcriptional regulator with XRE-family HTH domain